MGIYLFLNFVLEGQGIRHLPKNTAENSTLDFIFHSIQFAVKRELLVYKTKTQH